MNMSLASFFKRTPPATLDTCDQEQLHLFGIIQNTGALLVVDCESDVVLGASENIAPFLGQPVESLLGKTLAAIAPDIAGELADLAEGTNVVHEILEAQRNVDGASYDTVTHIHDGKRFIEFILNQSPSATQAQAHAHGEPGVRPNHGRREFSRSDADCLRRGPRDHRVFAREDLPIFA